MHGRVTPCNKHRSTGYCTARDAGHKRKMMFPSNVALPNTAFERTRRSFQFFLVEWRWRRAAQLGR